MYVYVECTYLHLTHSSGRRGASTCDGGEGAPHIPLQRSFVLSFLVVLVVLVVVVLLLLLVSLVHDIVLLSVLSVLVLVVVHGHVLIIEYMYSWK